MDFCLSALVICWDNLNSDIEDVVDSFRMTGDHSGLASLVRPGVETARRDLTIIADYEPRETPAAQDLFGRFGAVLGRLESLVDPGTSHSDSAVFAALVAHIGGNGLGLHADPEAVLARVPFRGVVSVDLEKYSDSVKQLNPDVNNAIRTLLVGGLNRRIEALMTAGVDPETQILSVQGDGALLAFSKVSDAHNYGVRLHRAMSEYNSAPSQSPHRFRIGMSWGRIFFHANQNGLGGVNRISTGGYAIVAAVRLQSVVEVGATLVEADFYKSLDVDEQRSYEPDAKLVVVKHKDEFKAHRSL